MVPYWCVPHHREEEETDTDKNGTKMMPTRQNGSEDSKREKSSLALSVSHGSVLRFHIVQRPASVPKRNTGFPPPHMSVKTKKKAYCTGVHCRKISRLFREMKQQER
jgi:hypothetical protein